MDPLIPQELLRRLEAGDRAPELWQQINEAAWQSFHDPWEREPSTTEIPLVGADMEAEELLPFNLDMIERYLQSRNVTFWKKASGSCMVQYSYDAESDREVRAFFSVQGKNADIFCLRLISDRRVEAPQFELAWRLCSTWSADYRWPRAYLELPDPPDPAEAEAGEEKPWNPSGTLVLDFQIPLVSSLTQGLFDGICTGMLRGSWSFWNLARSDFGL